MTPQAKTILKHLIDGRHITPLEALGVYGVFRLAARIFEIRDAGWRVDTQIVHDAKRKQYARYVLVRPHHVKRCGTPVYLITPLPVPVFGQPGSLEQAAA